MAQETHFNRITLVVLDGAGIGAMPDAPEWGDAGSDTFGHICESRQLNLPNLQSLGLGNISPLSGVPAISNPRGGFGKCAREYAPLIVYGKKSRNNVNLGTRKSLSDIGQTIAENFQLNLIAGESFLNQLLVT